MNRLSREALLEVPCEVAYAVVVDVLQYPDFLPGCGAVQIIEETKSGLLRRLKSRARASKKRLLRPIGMCLMRPCLCLLSKGLLSV